MFERYFNKNGDYKPTIHPKPHSDLGIVVVIPSYNEIEIERSLQSLAKCDRPNCSVEIIIVVNFPEGSSNDVVANSELSISTIQKIDIESNDIRFRFHYIFAPNLPKKHAGVGLARKIGMDEAAWRFNVLNNQNGIIACFDADSQCESNYLVELEKLWQNHPKTTACSIRFEHPVNGNEFNHKVYQGIAQYELHLRYYNQASRFIEFPFAYHTIGSSMACSVSTYIRVGGMNRNQAGEDFYFLQKIIPHGNFRELNSTCIYPSPRPSYRVPFGTGRAMMKYIENNDNCITSYNLDSFLSLKPLFNSINNFYSSDVEYIKKQVNSFPSYLAEYLTLIKAAEKIAEVKMNTSNLESFRKRFFLWFDAFQLLKYLNYINENHFVRSSIIIEASRLLNSKGVGVNSNDPVELLNKYRRLDIN